MGINSVKQFLRSERDYEDKLRSEFERITRAKENVLKLIIDSRLRFKRMAFRQALDFTISEVEKERIYVNKQRGICKRILSNTIRLMSAGYNKLLEDSKSRKSQARSKVKFIIKTLRDKDSAQKLTAYNHMKTRYLMDMGVGMANQRQLKIQLLKRLTNKSHNLQVMAVNGIREFLNYERDLDEQNRLEFERQQKEKDRYCKRLMNTGLRFCGMAFRQAHEFMENDREREILLAKRQRGVIMGMLDKNARLMRAGYNKLIEEAKARKAHLKDRLKFVLKSLVDKDARLVLSGYNQMKQRWLMLNGIGMGDAQMKKISFVKR